MSELPYKSAFRARIHARRGPGFRVRLPVPVVLVRPAPRIMACAERHATEHPAHIELRLLAHAASDEDCAGAVVVNPVATGRGIESPDAFTVRVGEHIGITAAGLPGAFYALQEVFLWLGAYVGTVLPAGTVRAAPALRRRWVCVDCAPCAAFTVEYLFRVLDVLAAFRVNGLVLNLHANFTYATVPGLGGPEALTPEDMAALTRHAHERFITLVPGIDIRRSGDILALERYRQSNGPDAPDSSSQLTGLYVRMATELQAATGAHHMFVGADDSVPEALAAALARLKCTPLVTVDADGRRRNAVPRTGRIVFVPAGQRTTGDLAARTLYVSHDCGDAELTIPYERCTQSVTRSVRRARTRHAAGCAHHLSGLENGHALPCALPYACFAGAQFWSGAGARDTDAVMDAVTARLFGSSHTGWRTAQQAFDKEMQELRALAGNGAATLQFRTQCFYPGDFVNTVTSRFADLGLQRVENLTALVWRTERALAELADDATRSVEMAGLLRLPVLFFQVLLCAFEQTGRCEQEYHLAACTEQEEPGVSRGHLIRASIAVQRIAERYGDLLELHHYLWRHCGAPRRDIKLLRAMYHHLTRLATTIERQGKRPYPLQAFHELLRTQFAHDDGHFRDRVPIPAEKLWMRS